LTIPEIVDAINPPHKALGLGYFASQSNHRRANRNRAYLRLNIRPGGSYLVYRGWLALAPNGMLNMTRARLQGMHEYHQCEGRLIVAVQKMRESHDSSSRDSGDSGDSGGTGGVGGAMGSLDAYAQTLTRVNGYATRLAASAMLWNAERTCRLTGCTAEQLKEWAKLRFSNESKDSF
jgi:hypothetical protein